ncbi:peptidase inhibitor family I36 protein [Dactylosporangium sp. CA-152071]|uniref:peptidase inhibitor family I36 protein n=1 Tax=Dactylosporangium sp. CA-152071 TaxID=3239933 RepID=UPI003D8DF197
MVKALKALVVTLPAIAIAVVVAPPAALAHRNDCFEPNNFCAWSDDNYEGRRVRWNQGVNDVNWGVHRGMSNDAESLYNHTESSTTVPDNVQTFLDINYGRRGICIEPMEFVDTFMNDNDYDSHTWVHSCG